MSNPERNPEIQGFWCYYMTSFYRFSPHNSFWEATPLHRYVMKLHCCAFKGYSSPSKNIINFDVTVFTVLEGRRKCSKVGGARAHLAHFYPCNAIGLMLKSRQSWRGSCPSVPPVPASLLRGTGNVFKLGGGGGRIPACNYLPTTYDTP